MNLTLGKIDAAGKITYDCPTRGSLSLSASSLGNVTATLNAQMEGGSSVQSFEFTAGAVLEPSI